MTEEEDNLQELDLDLCDYCHRLGFERAAIDDKNDIMWLCVGEIIKPVNPEDFHDLINEIRLCVLRDNDSDDVISFEWTPYETSRVAMALTWAVSNHLHQFQPKLEDMESLQESLSSETK